MANLQPLLDAARAADAKKIQIRDEILRLAALGDEDSVKQANILRPQLEAAQKKADEANALYTTTRDASLVNDNAALLFTVPDPAKDQPGQRLNGAKGPTMIPYADYRAMNPVQKHDVIVYAAKHGGVKIV